MSEPVLSPSLPSTVRREVTSKEQQALGRLRGRRVGCVADCNIFIKKKKKLFTPRFSNNNNTHLSKIVRVVPRSRGLRSQQALFLSHARVWLDHPEHQKAGALLEHCSGAAWDDRLPLTLTYWMVSTTKWRNAQHTRNQRLTRTFVRDRLRSTLKAAHRLGGDERDGALSLRPWSEEALRDGAMRGACVRSMAIPAEVREVNHS